MQENINEKFEQYFVYKSLCDRDEARTHHLPI